MTIRGVRGANIAQENTHASIYQATQELLLAMQEANPSLHPNDLASAFFTLTQDLDAAFPALAARDMGWSLVPMLCAREIAVPGSMPGLVRVLLHWNTDLSQSEINHVYLGETASLRPDLVNFFEI